MDARRSEYGVDPIFLNRWSPRGFDQASISRAELFKIVEAAKWAPSAYNIQPWRFVYSLRDDGFWKSHLALLDDFNQSWAKDASALIFILANTVTVNEETNKQYEVKTAGFDTGAAWAQLALQASLMGYHAHAIAGLDFEGAKATLQLPEAVKLQAGIAIGRKGNIEDLPVELQERETPSPRKPVQDLLFAGNFSHDD
ncbi:MAG: nitroreductase family protein [Sneathiellales bacterium]|nr:nitroreductase family protein [Sneathiellales bacterium]